MKVRKKPVEVEAWHVNDIIELYFLLAALPDPVAEAVANGTIIVKNDHISINTLEGDMIGQQNDVLIRGVKGEFYPCKANIFSETYEVV